MKAKRYLRSLVGTAALTFLVVSGVSAASFNGGFYDDGFYDDDWYFDYYEIDMSGGEGSRSQRTPRWSEGDREFDANQFYDDAAGSGLFE